MFFSYNLKLPLRMNPREYYENMWYILVLHVPIAYPNTTKKIPLGHPLLTPLEGVDGKVDFSVNIPAFR